MNKSELRVSVLHNRHVVVVEGLRLVLLASLHERDAVRQVLVRVVVDEFGLLVDEMLFQSDDHGLQFDRQPSGREVNFRQSFEAASLFVVRFEDLAALVVLRDLLQLVEELLAIRQAGALKSFQIPHQTLKVCLSSAYFSEGPLNLWSHPATFHLLFCARGRCSGGKSLIASA